MSVSRITIRRRRAMAAIVAVAMGVGVFPAVALADIGVPGGSYLGTSAPTAEKPQSKLWYHADSWWGALFNPVSQDFEIHKYTKSTWSWSTTGVKVDIRPEAKLDALLDGTSLYIVASVPSGDGLADKKAYLHRFSYNGSTVTSAGAPVALDTSAIEDIVLAKDSSGVLWANWTEGGSVYVTHSAVDDPTSWITPYTLATGLQGGLTGDTSSIVAFAPGGVGNVGVMWSNENGTAEEGFHFAWHADGTSDDPVNWHEEDALVGLNQADDHINLKAVGGEVLAAVKHDHALGTEAQISVLRRDVLGTWTTHVVWTNATNVTRPIIEVDTSAGRAHVFASGMFSGIVYRKDALVSDLAFGEPSLLGSSFLSLSTDLALNNVTSTKQNVTSSSGLLVMAGDDTTHRYAFNYLTLDGPDIVPAFPTGVTGLTGIASVALSWSAPGNDGGSPVTGYEVTPHLNGVPLPLLTKIFNTTATTQTILGLAVGTTYTFTVKAISFVGTGPASAASAPVATLGAPGAPTGVSAFPGNNSATVSWVPPASDGGSLITGYTVTSSPGGFTATAGGTATSVVVTGLTNGTSYTFTVTATSIVGTGPSSAPSAPVVPLAVPGAPTGVSVVPGNTSVTVSWNAPGDAGGSAISGYVVSWAVDGATQSTRTFTSPATTQTVTGLANGTTYTFKASAINAAGTGPASSASGVVTPRTVPGAPSGVTAAAGNASAVVSWNAPAGNGGSPITGYEVTPHLNGVAQAPTSFGSSATIQTVGGLQNSGTYTFTVKAANAAGLGAASAHSAPIFTSSRIGYWMLASDGLVYPFGDAQDVGEPAASLGGVAAVDIEPNTAGSGYWVVDALGRVYTYGVPWLGNADTSRFRRNEVVTSLSATPAGDGYWIFTNRGRVLAFGNARSHGDMLDVTLNGPVLDSIATPSGKGYYMVASDGGVFTFGDATFHGSTGSLRLNAPVQSLVPDPDGLGYWLVASDGGVFTFETTFRGSMGGIPLNRPVTGMVPFGNGYLMVGEDGGIFNFSDMPFRGSLGANPPASPVVSVAVLR